MQLGSLQYPHNPMKGFLSVLAGTYDNTVRNIDIDRGLPAPQLHRGLPDRAIAQSEEALQL